MVYAGLALLAAALIVLAVVSQRRHERLRERLRRLDALPEEVHRLRAVVYAHELAERLRTQGRTPALAPAFRSQYGEDALLWDLLGDRPTGTYVEVGAFDGVSASVTYAFEAAGWTGALIEPLPERFEACRRARPGSRVINAALGPAGSAGTTTFTTVEGAEMLSYVPHEGMEDSHLQTIRSLGGRERRVTVPLTTMDAALEQAGVDRLDFAVLDVEGGELALLKGFSLERFRPRVMVVEDNSHGARSEVAEHVTSRGYVQTGWVGINRVFVRADEAGLLARAAELEKRRSAKSLNLAPRA